MGVITRIVCPLPGVNCYSIDDNMEHIFTFRFLLIQDLISQ